MQLAENERLKAELDDKVHSINEMSRKTKVFSQGKADFKRFINATKQEHLKAKLIALLNSHDTLIVRSK